MHISFCLCLLCLAANFRLAISLQVSTDSALLSALKNNNITDIVLTKSIKLGENRHASSLKRIAPSHPFEHVGSIWSYINPPIRLERNVTLTSSSPSVVLDLDFYADTLHLGYNVMFTFNNMAILNGKRKFPLGECSHGLGPKRY